MQAQLLMAALVIALRLLRTGGTFVAKIFKKDRADLLYSQVLANPYLKARTRQLNVL